MLMTASVNDDEAVKSQKQLPLSLQSMNGSQKTNSDVHDYILTSDAGEAQLITRGEGCTL